MDILDTIITRRSIRAYNNQIPEDSQIENILDAGRWAPSGLNNQPWRFMVIKDKTRKDGLARFSEYGGIIESAPMVLLVFMDKNTSYNRDKDLMAIGASIQNMLLYAHSQGLAACWLGEILNKKVEVSKFLKLSSNLELAAVVAYGYCDEGVKEGKRKMLKDLLIK
ncbi:MAG TPA: nitroreductase family protein [Candidatus Omnitrophica bacterium]|nr:nitroreductase family protein [Candidatus Omnitrophota bacterium]